MTNKDKSTVEKKIPVEVVPNEKKMSVESSPINLSMATSQFTNMVGNFGGKVNGKSGIPSFFSYDPYIQNSRLKGLKTAVAFPDRDDLEEGLKNPQMNELLLRSTSWSLIANSYPYYKMLRLYSDILLYNGYSYPKFVDKKEFSTPRFKQEQKLVNQWLDKFDAKRTFRRITMETMIEGKRAYVYRQNVSGNDVEYALLQELPSNWWKPTFKSNDSYYGVSFNFAYFWTPGTTVDQFPPIFQSIYSELMGFSYKDTMGKVKINFDKVPSKFEIEYNKEVNKWYVWAEMPASDVWCFSADESNSWQVPPFMGLFLSYQDLGSYQFLQTQLASIPLYGILSGEVALHDEKLGSSQAIDDLRLSPAMIEDISGQAKGMTPPGVSAMFAPVSNIKFHQFLEQVNSSKIYTEALQQVISTSGLTGLQSTSEKPTVAMVNASKLIEKRFADIFYPQFIKFVNVVFEKKLNLRYTWMYDLFGDVFSEKDSMADLQKQIAAGQIYLMPKMLAYYNLDASSATCISEWMDATKLYDLMKAPPSAFTQASGSSTPAPKGAKKEKVNGRPPIDEGAIDNDNTAANSDLGINKGADHTFSVNVDDEIFEDIVTYIEDCGGKVEL